MAELKDNGERREFGTGAVRDVAEGKGRCDLLPLTVVGKLLDSEELKLIGKYKESKDTNFLLEACRVFSFKTNVDLFTLILELSKHFEDGARKYTENNWMKGIPIHCYIDSGTRHFIKFLRGDTDEPHDRAFLWNMICAVWTMDNKPELDDIEKDIEKKSKEDEPVNHSENDIRDNIYKCAACKYETYVNPTIKECRGCGRPITPSFLKQVEYKRKKDLITDIKNKFSKEELVKELHEIPATLPPSHWHCLDYNSCIGVSCPVWSICTSGLRKECE